jgi:N-acetylmuramoyl-L-alanine amidase
MKIINVIKDLPSKGSNGKMDPKKIDTLVVHHDAAIVSGPYNTMKRIKIEADYHVKQGWKHLSYHYVIDNVGDVYQCLQDTEIGYHAGNYVVNKKSIAVCLHGNFEKQNPTPKQLAALERFVNWITTERPDLPILLKKSVKGHREVRLKGTACPGSNLFPFVVKLRK